MRWPGIEPGSIAWKATMLTIIPPTLIYVFFSFTIDIPTVSPTSFLERRTYHKFCIDIYIQVIVSQFAPYSHVKQFCQRRYGVALEHKCL